MMNPRENLISLLRRKGYGYVPMSFDLCPSLRDEFSQRTGEDPLNYWDYFQFPWRQVFGVNYKPSATVEEFRKLYPDGLKVGTHIDNFGVAHEPGSEAAKHMTHMVCPMRSFEDIEQFKAYPYPTLDISQIEAKKIEAQELHKKGLVSRQVCSRLFGNQHG